MHAFAKIGLATTAFALVHSALASRKAKDIARKMVGERACEGSYRVFYNSQSIITFSLLILYGMQLRTRTVYHVHGRSALLLRAGQAAGLLHLAATIRTAGFLRLSGLANLQAWLRGGRIPPAPVAQGPERDANGKLHTGGPFSWSRHPLNFSALPVIWLTPHMTARRLAFNLVSSLYFMLGSLHEAARLRHAYGADYAAYERSGVPFFWPGATALTSPGAAILQLLRDGARVAPHNSRHAHYQMDSGL